MTARNNVHPREFLYLLAGIFVSAFLLNFLWEHLHALLYIHYQGKEITNFVLFRAALFDAAVITILGAVFLRSAYLWEQKWIAVIAGVVFAVGLEWFALLTHRWAYNGFMPIVPILGTGLTPTFQLGVTAYLVFWFVDNMFRR